MGITLLRLRRCVDVIKNKYILFLCRGMVMLTANLL